MLNRQFKEPHVGSPLTFKYPVKDKGMLESSFITGRFTLNVRRGVASEARLKEKIEWHNPS